MKSIRAGTLAVFAFAVILLLTPWSAPAAEEVTGAFFKPESDFLAKVFDDFSGVGLDLETPLQVNDVTLKKDTLELHFNSGVLYLAEPIEGEITGAIFEGEGTMTLTLLNEMEKKALQREYGSDTLREPFTQVVMRFNDDSAVALREMARPASQAPEDPSKTWAARNKILYRSDNLPMSYLESRLNGIDYRDFFVADVNTTNFDWLSYALKNRNRIEVGLWHESSAGGGKKQYDTWCRFHRKEDYDKKGNYSLLPEGDDKELAILRHVGMELQIPNTKSVVIDTTVRVESRIDDMRAVKFNMINNYGRPSWEDEGRPVKIEMVADGAGNPLSYIHKQHQLLVALTEPLARGATTEIRVKATEDTIIQLTSATYLIVSTYSWFPQIGQSGGRYTIDWTVKVAKPMTAAGTGDLVREWEEDDMNCAQWKTSRAVQFPSFIFGKFKIAEGEAKRDGDNGDSIPLRIYTIKGGRAATKGNMENIMFNIEQGIKNYESIFGEFPYDGLDITQMPKGMGFGQSPPGVMFLTGSGVEGGGGGGSIDQFVFHELAHQWWGNQVGWVSGEDDWISESWAEYASGLLTEGIDPKRFEMMREEWRNDAYEADASGTIATAYHSGYRTKLLYDKGPMVIHMLRTWMGWEKFTELTMILQTEYKDQNINTDTVARETSKLLGYDMFPFFDQWIRDQGIPTVRYSWKATKADGGKFLVTIKVRQEDQDNFKILMMPIALDFGQGEPVRVSKPMLKPITEFKLMVPAKPKDIELDDQHSQYARIRPEGK